jgi:hypothetical protein
VFTSDEEPPGSEVNASDDDESFGAALDTGCTLELLGTFAEVLGACVVLGATGTLVTVGVDALGLP